MGQACMVQLGIRLFAPRFIVVYETRFNCFTQCYAETLSQRGHLFYQDDKVCTQADFLMVAVLEAAISNKNLGQKKEGGVLNLTKVPRRHCLSGTHTQTQPVLLKDTKLVSDWPMSSAVKAC